MKHWFTDLTEFRRDPLGFLLDRGCNATEPLERLYLGKAPVYLVTDPALVKPVMQAKEEDVDKGRLVHKLRAIVGKSSLTISGEEHRQRRAVIHAQLARGISNMYVPQISAIIRHNSTQLAKMDQFNAHYATAPLALRIISAALFGHGVLSPSDENALVHAVNLVEDELADGMFRVLPNTPWAYYKNKQNLKLARSIMDMVVERTRDGASASSLLRSLQDMDLTAEELRDELLMILLAGHHTTGTAAAWVLYYIATSDELAQALVDESVAICGPSGEIEAKELTNARVSQALVREVLRLYPSAWWFSREVKREFSIAGKTLQPGTSLLASPWHLGRDPRFWDNPEEFDLNRPAGNKAYFPFGVGPRACVGMGFAMMELQLIALEFASAYSLKMCSTLPLPKPKPSITLIPPEILIKLGPRLPHATSAKAA